MQPKAVLSGIQSYLRPAGYLLTYSNKQSGCMLSLTLCYRVQNSMVVSPACLRVCEVNMFLARLLSVSLPLTARIHTDTPDTNRIRYFLNLCASLIFLCWLGPAAIAHMCINWCPPKASYCHSPLRCPYDFHTPAAQP